MYGVHCSVIILPTTVWERGMVMSMSVLGLCVSLREYLGIYRSQLHRIFCVSMLPWLARPLVSLQYVIYFRFCG